MSCQYCLVFVFLFGFAALSVSEVCDQHMLEGTSCTMKLPTRNIDKNNDITWVHLSGDAVIQRKNGNIRKTYTGLKLEEDGSLKFERVNVKNTGKYRYTVFNKEGTQIDAGEKEITVYEVCNQHMLEGTSCTIKLPTENIDKNNEIKWVHLSGDAVIQRKNGNIRKTFTGLILEEDGSLKFESVNVKNTGKYRYTVFNKEGRQIDAGEKEITVYAKAPKPTLRLDCRDVVKLICEAKDRTDLTFSWNKDSKIIQNEKNSELVLSSEEVKDNKPYTCSVSNPVSSELSDRVTVSCTGTGKEPGPGDGNGSLVPRKLFGFDFWIMVSILAGGGTLLLLLLCVVIICACRSCKQKKQQEEREFRMRYLQAPDSTKTDPNAAET